MKTYACMNGLILPGRQVMLVDTHVNYDPTAEQLAEITILAAQEMCRFGLTPKAALLSHSNFGTSNCPSAVKMRDTLALIQQLAPWLEVDGEMHGDVALDGKARAALMPNTTLQGDANLLVLPTIDAANIAYNLLKTAAGGGIAIGPVRVRGKCVEVRVHRPVRLVARRSGERSVEGRVTELARPLGHGRVAALGGGLEGIEDFAQSGRGLRRREPSVEDRDFTIATIVPPTVPTAADDAADAEVAETAAAESAEAAEGSESDDAGEETPEA